MALYTPAQWAKIQAGMPPEDKISYADYVRQSGVTLEQLKTAEASAATPAKESVSAVESAAAVRAAAAAAKKIQDDAAAKLAAENAYYTKIVSNGKTQAQIDALQNAVKTATEITGAYSGIGITSTVDPVTGKVVTTNNTAAKIAADKAAADKAAADKAAAEAERDRIAAEAAAAAAKTAKELEEAKAALIAANKAAADAAAAAKAAADKALADAIATGEANAIAAAKAAAEAAAAEAAAKAANSNLNVSGNVVLETAGQTTEDKAATDYAKLLAEQQKTQQRESIIAILTDRFNKYNLSSLAKTIKDLAVDGATEATITLALQETEDYKRRFKANETRMKNGLQVLNPAEYLNLEDGYRQVLRAYGLKQFDTDEYVSQFIANDVSAAEMSNRVVTAVQRVQNADPAIQKQLRDYYGIGQEDLVAYVLDPQQQFQKIERQVAASEIGVAAGRQGLKAGVGVAEQLAAQGVTQAEAQKGYATIADILPTAEKLSSIYGKTMDTYGQSEAEQEVFNSLASAQRKRQQLTAREIAAFSGMSGANRTSLTTSSVGQF